MALTPLTLIWLGTMAFVTSGAGVFARFGDRYTGPLVAFLGAVFWGFFGLSAFDVAIHDSGITTLEPMLVFVAIGFGMAFVVGLFAIHDYISGGVEEAADVQADLLGER